MSQTLIEKIQDKVLYANDNEAKRAYYLTDPIELANPTQKIIPYTPLFQKGDKALSYIGLHHTRDPESEEIKLINKTVEEFKPDCILFESLQNINEFREDMVKGVWKDIEKYGWATVALNYIKNIGENYYLFALAVYKNISFDTIEGTKKEETNYLLKKEYSKDQIFFTHCLGTLISFHRGKHPSRRTEEHLVEVTQRTIDDVIKNTDWPNYDFSLEHFKELYKQFIHVDFDITDEESYRNYASYWLTDKANDYGIFNQINADSIYIRDRSCVKKIYLSLQEHNRIMAVMGSDHPILQQPAIRQIFELLSWVNIAGKSRESFEGNRPDIKKLKALKNLYFDIDSEEELGLELYKNKVPFEMVIYEGNDHSISQNRTRANQQIVD